MEIELDADEMAQAIVDDDAAVDKLVEAISGHLADKISEMVNDGFDYNQDRFRLSWMRMMEVEAYDLSVTSRESACEHGQKVLNGFDRACREYLSSQTVEAQRILGVDGLVQTITELVEAAVQARLKNVTSNGFTVDARPTIEADVPFKVARPTHDDFGNEYATSQATE